MKSRRALTGLVAAALLGCWMSPGFGASEGDVKKHLAAAVKRGDKTAAAEAIAECGELKGDKGAKLLLANVLKLGLMGLIDEVVQGLS